jgi:hypothetical protein
MAGARNSGETVKTKKQKQVAEPITPEKLAKSLGMNKKELEAFRRLIDNEVYCSICAFADRNDVPAAVGFQYGFVAGAKTMAGGDKALHEFVDLLCDTHARGIVTMLKKLNSEIRRRK